MQITSNSPVFICKAHYCENCKGAFNKKSNISKCVKCYKSYHSLQNALNNNCINLDEVIPISNNKHMCKEHINIEIEMLKNSD